jgi:hypothetical protein
MVMKKSLLFFIVLLAVRSVFSQTVIDYSRFAGTKINVSLTNRLNEPYFKSYGSSFTEEYVKLNQLDGNRFTGGPEQILYKVYTAASVKELKQIFNKDANVDLKSFKATAPLTDTSRNFIILRHKLTLTVEQQELCIIKYTQFIDSTAVKNYTLQVIGRNGNWKGTKLSEYSDIEYALLNITSEEFWSLSKKTKLDEDDKAIAPTIISAVKDDEGILNLSKLARVIRERREQGKAAIE